MNASQSDSSPNTTTPLIALTNVSYAVNEKILVQEVSFDIYPNSVISLIGPNGAGKSTLVKLILGLITPSQGNIHRQKNLIIGYVPQKFSLPNVLPLQVQDLLNQTRKNRLDNQQKQAILDNLNIQPLKFTQVATLSGGELQRVLLAKALLDKPGLLVLDEPMQGLDPEAQILLYQLIDSLPDFLRCAMLVVSHDLHWVMKGTKHVICLNKHICCHGRPTEIAQAPEFVALFGHYAVGEHQLETPYIHQQHHCQHHA